MDDDVLIHMPLLCSISIFLKSGQLRERRGAGCLTASSLMDGSRERGSDFTAFAFHAASIHGQFHAPRT